MKEAIAALESLADKIRNEVWVNEGAKTGVLQGISLSIGKLRQLEDK